MAEEYHDGEIGRDENDRRRYCCPQYDDPQMTAKIPTQEFTDAMVKAFKGKMTE